MDFFFLKKQLELHPVLTLLRSRSNALILSFFFRVFKEQGKISLSHEEMLLELATHMEDCGENPEEEGRNILEDCAVKLSRWCDESHGFLRKYHSPEGQILYELTSASEKALRWVEDLQEKDFVGTESRFTNIFQRLRELAEKTVDDPELRIADLKDQKKEIDREIREIRKTGKVSHFSDHQIHERFEGISRDARHLVADFTEVEENFKKIVSRIYEKELGESRGNVLGLTLDATDDLKNSPQGKSFYNFWHFLMTDYGKDQINTYVDEIYEQLNSGDDENDVFLRKLKYYLHQAGRKIINTNHSLTDKINRLLSDSWLSESRQIKKRAEEIKQLVMTFQGDLPAEVSFMEIEGAAAVALPLERPLMVPEKTVSFKEPEPSSPEEPENLLALFDQFYVDTEALHRQIKQELKIRDKLFLEEMLDLHPPQKGLSEVLAYLHLASRNRRHYILEEQFFYKDIKGADGRVRQIKIPQVVYGK